MTHHSIDIFSLANELGQLNYVPFETGLNQGHLQGGGVSGVCGLMRIRVRVIRTLSKVETEEGEVLGKGTGGEGGVRTEN